jgi:hypothetical protein
MPFHKSAGFLLTGLVLISIAVRPASAQRAGIGITVGTLGPGASVGINLTDRFNVRAGGSYFSVSVDDNIDDEVDIDLSGDARIGAVSALADYHVFRNSFRVTGGVRINLLQVSGDGIPTEPYCFGDEIEGVCQDKEFAPEKLGTLGGTVKYSNPVQPYLGIGFGNLAHGSSRVTAMFDLGVIYTGSPEIDLKASGLLSPTANRDQEKNLNDGLESFVLYPVFSFGIGFRL